MLIRKPIQQALEPLRSRLVDAEPLVASLLLPLLPSPVLLSLRRRMERLAYIFSESGRHPSTGVWEASDAASTALFSLEHLPLEESFPA